MTPDMVIPVALLALCVCAVAQESAPLRATWERVVEHAEFSPRDTSEPAVFLGKMWLSNAYHNGNVLIRDLWCSEDGTKWTQVLDNTPYDGYSEFAVYDGKLWAIKGSVWNTEDGVHWNCVSEKTPFGVRSYGEVVVFDGRMWQLGSGADVWWTTDGESWTRVIEEAPYGKRWGSAVAAYKGKLWLMGGSVPVASDPPEKHYASITTLNDVWCSEDGEHWACVLEHAPWLQRQWFVAEEYTGRLWTLGGFSNRESRNFAESWYTEDGVTWNLLQSDPIWSPRHEVSPYVFDGSLWVVAGNAWPLMNDVWRLTVK
jgi:hypothetical protein